MIENYNMAINGIKLNKEKEKEMKTNWYYNCYSIINYLNNPEILQKLGVMNMNILFEYVIIRIIFDLQFNDMIDLFNYLYNDKNKDKNKDNQEIEQFLSGVKTVIEKYYIMKKDERKGILLIKEKKRQFKNKKDESSDNKKKVTDIGLVLVLYDDNDNDYRWYETERITDYNSMHESIKKDIVIKKNLNETIGFLMYFIGKDYLIFKTKNLKGKRNTGSRCDQKTINKNKNILYDDILDKVAGLKDYFINKDDKEKDIFENKKSICIMQEFMLYIFNENKVNGKIWFLDPIKSILSNIENV